MINNNEVLNEFSANTNVGLFLNEMKNLNSAENQKLYEEKYLPIIKSEKKEKSPFLTVLIRTQGKREDGLREALLCLNAQQNQDFEIILIAHKVNNEQEKVVYSILEDQQDEFKQKIRYYKLDEGTRTTPLNFGFAHAWGKYIAIFDDDDILFDNWVDCFWNKMDEFDGRIIHSYAFSQTWKNVKDIGYRAETAPVANYCGKFDAFTQLTVNRCPLMTLAFPAYLFQKVGMVFNEELNVMEDWEYFMRASFLCGVTDSCEPTAIYRFWKNVESSASLHDQSDWDQTYREVQETFNKKSVILPTNTIKTIIGLIEQKNSNNLLNTEGEIVSQLFYCGDSGFDVNQVIKTVNKAQSPAFDLWFLFENKTNEVKTLRFDLCEDGLFVLKDLCITIWFTNGEKKEVYLKDCIHNGIERLGSILFINEDPEIIWELEDDRRLDVINISGTMSRKIPKIPLLNTIINVFPLGKLADKRRLHKKGCF